jgi:hypothetical protein
LNPTAYLWHITIQSLSQVGRDLPQEATFPRFEIAETD